MQQMDLEVTLQSLLAFGEAQYPNQTIPLWHHHSKTVMTLDEKLIRIFNVLL